jgi:hypothetical protein
MPLYVYDCPECGAHIERHSSKYTSAEEDTAQVCGTEIVIDSDEEGLLGQPSCTAILKREEISEQLPPNTEGGYQMGVIMSDGSKVAGHFGKTAPNKGARHTSRMKSRKGENRKAIAARMKGEGWK